MPNENNRQDIRVKGNGNVVGDHNVVNSKREVHHHHHHGSSSKDGKSEDDAAGIGIGIIAAVLTVTWLFVQHSTEIYLYIKLGALVSGLPFLGVIILGLVWNATDNKQFVAAIFGFAVSAAAFLLALYGQESLDPKILEFSQQVKGAWVFWQGLTEHGHNVVIGSLIGAICVGATVFFALLMGVFVLWHFLAETDIEDSAVLRVLTPFRPSRGGVFATFLLLVAFAFQSGFVFEILKPATQ